MNKEERAKVVKDFTGAAVDSGNIIEIGWHGYRLHVLPHDASQVQIDETRIAFFAGAQHLYGCIMTILDPDSEPTDQDENRMMLIHNELERFRKELEENYPIEKGH